MNHPDFLRPLSAAEDDRGRRYYEALIPIIALRSGTAPTERLERVRVLNQHGGLNWSEPEHLIALAYAAEALGEEEAWLVVPENTGLDRAAVNLHGLAATVARHDLIDPDVFDLVTSGWSEEVIDMLAPPFVSEWTLVSTSGSWIVSTWNAGDLSVVAGSRGFLSTYVDRRPSASQDVITWLLTEGETPASDDVATSAIAQLRRDVARADFLFAYSELGEYLAAHYGENVADELWSITQRVRAADSRRALNSDERQFMFGPGMPMPGTIGVGDGDLGTSLVTVGSAQDRLSRLFGAEPQLPARLLEIWSA